MKPCLEAFGRKARLHALGYWLGPSPRRRTSWRREPPSGAALAASSADRRHLADSGNSRRALSLLLLALLAALLAGCGQDYGGALNHMHDLLVLRGTAQAPHTLLVASHIGLYRSTDDGQNWTAVAGLDGQPANGLMLYKLAQSPVDAKRVYVLAIPRPDNPAAAKDTSGIYTSDDSGVTWKLAASVSSFHAPGIFTIATGATGPGQVFALLPGDQGLYGSDDAGAHWHSLPLPAGNVAGLQGDPAHSGRLLLYSLSSGLFESDDSGQHWQSVSGISGGVSALCFAGSGAVYAQGDSGVYVSHDDGHSFTLANDKAPPFSALAGSPADAAHAYAVAGNEIFATTDGGTTWKQTAPTPRSPTTIAVDPTNATHSYVSLSTPIAVEETTDGGAHWKQILP